MKLIAVGLRLGIRAREKLAGLLSGAWYLLTLELSGGTIDHVHANWLSPIKVRTTTIGGSKRTLV
jgi:hypothetical protein